MHLQHSPELLSVTVFRASRARRVVLSLALCALYAASIFACVKTSGRPYARALNENRALEREESLSKLAAAHAARDQRLKAQKLASSVAERNEDEEASIAAAASAKADESEPKKPITSRQKAELVLEKAAKLAQASIEAADRGENKTEEELKRELFGDEEIVLEVEEEARPLPSKYLPDAWACLFFFVTLTLHALFYLMCHWVVGFRARALYVDSNDVNNKCHALIVPQKHKGRPALVPIRSSKQGGGLVVEYQRQLYEYWGPDDEDDVEDEWTSAAAHADDEEEDDEEVEEVVVEEDEVVGLGKENGSLRRVTPPLRLTLSHYATSTGLDSRAVAVAEHRYGKNVVEVKVPSFISLYKEQLLSPISMFQVFTSLLWLLDSYWQYVGFTLFSIVFMEAGTVFQRQRTLKSLSGMSARSLPVLVLRDNEWQELQSEDLLPGDLISITKRRHQLDDEAKNQLGKDPVTNSNAITDTKDTDGKKADKDRKKRRRKRRAVYNVPCDCLLLRGSAVVNEATLTGESTPQMKDSAVLDADANDDRPLDIFGRDRVSVLFSGTELINASIGVSGLPGVSEPPDCGAIAYVLRTGFSSAQGELMQMIEFSQQSVSSDTRETLLALLVLLVFALVSAAYVLKRGLEKGDRTTHELLLRCVIIVTSVVPRQLPMQMALAVNTALMALMKAGIMATEPYRVPYAGRVRHCLFDKTGTLTTDRLSPVGVICYNGEKNTSAAPRHTLKAVNAASDVAAVVIAACHSLVSADAGDDEDEATQSGNDNAAPGANSRLVGDPIELTALRALGWLYDAKTSIAVPPIPAIVAVEKREAKDHKASHKAKAATTSVQSAYRRVRIISRYHFSSALQRMSVIAEVTAANGRSRCAALVKGSPEAIKSLLAENSAPAWYDATYASLAERGMRVLALSYKWMDDKLSVTELPRADVESELQFCGFIAFECRTRADSGIVCLALRQSSHRVAMVTGDAPLTALHVARSTSISEPQAQALLLTLNDSRPLGVEWVSPHTPPKQEPVAFSVNDVGRLVERGFTLVVTEAAIVEGALKAAEDAAASVPASVQDQSERNPEATPETDVVKAAEEHAEEAVWSSCATHAAVFARMSPQGKARICRSLQRIEGTACVLMCGDGGNDVGALKQADVGLALLAGYGDANTTGDYTDIGEKLAKGRKQDAKAEDVLNAQAEALADVRDRNAETRKKHLASRQKELMSLQKVWIEEELARRAEKGEKGIGAQFGAVKAVAMRLKREMAQEVDKIDAKLGNVYDNTGDDGDETDEKSPQDLAADLLGGGGDEGGLPIIRPGDASVAAPFTSRAPSIRAVVDLIRQGRCTLLSSLQQQQTMVLESIISAYTLASLSLEGARSSERQMMASGWLLIVASMAFSYSTPVDKMSPVRPISSLFDPSVVVSVIGQGAIHIFCMRQAFKLATERMGPAALDAVVKFQRRAKSGEITNEESNDEDDVLNWFMSLWSTPFLPNLLNTAVFLVETSQMIAVLFVNFKGRYVSALAIRLTQCLYGRPFMKGFLENHALFLSLFIAIAGLVILAWGSIPELNDLLHLAPFPDDEFRFKIAGLVFAALFGTFIWDRLATALFAPHIFKAMLNEAKATTMADLTPVLTTAFKVIFGTLLLVQGNLLVLAAAAYMYRQYNKQLERVEKERKKQLVAKGTANQNVANS